ncbi:MAG: helix-turn-helix domain-containing protein [Polyangiales bacterium]
MRAVTDSSDYRVQQVRETMLVAGRWTRDVEKVVIEAINSAYEDGRKALGGGNARYRILRWIATNEREEGSTHLRIAEECGTTRETVTRTISKLRKDGSIWTCGKGPTAMCGLTPDGKRLALSIDSMDSRELPGGGG